MPGDYIVTFTNPNGAQQATVENVNGSADDEENNDSDIDATGSTGVITLSSGENELDIDAGYLTEPDLDLEKTFVSATVQADGSYDVVYTIAVTNSGGATGTYGLTDTPSFDDDVTINSGTFTGEASGTLTSGTTTLTMGNSIAGGATEDFTLTYNVTLNLSGDANDNDNGDNSYTSCSTGGPNGNGAPDQGLYNLAELDTNNDGQPDGDDACGDLPSIDLEKTFVSATVQADSW